MTNRISRLKTALFANTREISLERALLYTASHRQTEGEPVILRRAKATAYILEHVEISIRDCNQVNHLIPTRVLVKGGEITCKILK
ncbi:pyruvate formate lyase family protein [Escherichia coli]